MSYNPLKPARPTMAYLVALTLAAILLILLSLLPVPARADTTSETSKAAVLLSCLTKSAATTKYPSRHLYYRTNTAGQKCWTGGKPGAREAYAVRGATQKATQSSQEASPEPKPFTAQEWSTMEDDALTALCGQPCGLLMPFGDRWRLK